MCVSNHIRDVVNDTDNSEYGVTLLYKSIDLIMSHFLICSD